ncbi:hypothetical protein K439DRAFT_1381207 [Ramaria rubella]|nr:hypothetical protein K439DRAFT_1381207 [Ramaria rubella]
MFPRVLHLIFTVPYALIPVALAGNVARGGNCTISNNHLDPATHKLLTDCNDKTFCTPQSICEPRQCRKDEFPFGYDPGESLPPMCPQGQYCPDEGDACKPLSGIGQSCQLNRDDQCAPPPTPQSVESQPAGSFAQTPLAISGASPMNADGSICLHLICMYANATLGSPCITDSTIYVGSGPKGEKFSAMVSRDNCISPGLYCNNTSSICQKSQELGQACQTDLECESYNCSVQNICTVPPETPVKVPAWQYASRSFAPDLTLCLLIKNVAMVGTCVILVLTHKRHRKQRYAEIREYYHEQLGYAIHK